MSSDESSLAIKRKRIRNKDYSNDELNVLVASYLEFYDVLSQKHIPLQDTAGQEKKRAAQAEIVRRVNSVGGNDRTSDSIREKWQNLKSNIKRKASDLNQQLLQNGERSGGIHDLLKQRLSSGKDGGLSADDYIEVESYLSQTELAVLKLLPADAFDAGNLNTNLSRITSKTIGEIINESDSNSMNNSFTAIHCDHQLEQSRQHAPLPPPPPPPPPPTPTISLITPPLSIAPRKQVLPPPLPPASKSLPPPLPHLDNARISIQPALIDLSPGLLPPLFAGSLAGQEPIIINGNNDDPEVIQRTGYYGKLIKIEEEKLKILQRESEARVRYFDVKTEYYRQLMANEILKGAAPHSTTVSHPKSEFPL